MMIMRLTGTLQASRKEEAAAAPAKMFWKGSFKSEINTHAIGRCRGGLGIVSEAFSGFA